MEERKTMARAAHRHDESQEGSLRPYVSTETLRTGRGGSGIGKPSTPLGPQTKHRLEKGARGSETKGKTTKD